MSSLLVDNVNFAIRRLRLNLLFDLLHAGTVYLCLAVSRNVTRHVARRPRVLASRSRLRHSSASCVRTTARQQRFSSLTSRLAIVSLSGRITWKLCLQVSRYFTIGLHTYFVKVIVLLSIIYFFLSEIM